MTTSGTNPNRTVTANFVKRFCNVGVQVGSGSGTVGGGGQVQCGTSVDITATASQNYCFGSWDGLLGLFGAPRSVNCPQSDNTSVEPTSSGVVSANFTRQSCRVNGSPNVATYGRVTGSATVPCGNRVPLTATYSLTT